MTSKLHKTEVFKNNIYSCDSAQYIVVPGGRSKDNVQEPVSAFYWILVIEIKLSILALIHWAINLA